MRQYLKPDEKLQAESENSINCWTAVTGLSPRLVVMNGNGTPLPELPLSLHNSATIFGAYPQILDLERNEQAAYRRDPSDDRKKRLIYTRILGYLIIAGPSAKASVAVALEVNACSGEEEKLLAIGRLYFDHYIRACKLQIFTSFSPFWKVLLQSE